MRRLEYWMKQIKALCQNAALVFLVGTHSELVSEIAVRNTISLLETTFRKALYPAFQNIIIPVSCSTGAGIQEVKNTLLSLADHSTLNQEVEPSWLYFQHLLGSLVAIGTERTDWNTYLRWATACGVAPESIANLTSVLETSGTIVHLNDPSVDIAQSHLILSPQWLADAMACLVTTKGNFINNGLIKSEDFARIFSDSEKFPECIRPSLLGLLEKYKILHKLEQGYLVPSMLPTNRPAHDILHHFPWHYNSSENAMIGRVFSFPSLPLGLFERLSVSLISGAYQCLLIWKHGIVLQDSQVKILIEFDDETSEMFVFFRYPFGVDTSGLSVTMQVILSMISNMISAFYPGLNESLRESFACIHCLRKGIPREGIHRFPKEQVLHAMETQQTIMYCKEICSPSRAVSLAYLAPDLHLVGVKQFQPGTIELGELLGEGTAGTVYKGILQGQVVAIKQLKVKFKSEEESQRKFLEFLSEASMMR